MSRGHTTRPRAAGPGTGGGRRRAGLAAALTAALTVAGLACGPQAAAEPCRTQVTGEELPDGAGPYPLIERLGLRQAWDLATGAGVDVAVIDSGVDARHPDLAGAVRRGSDIAVVADARDHELTRPRPVQDCEGHGTAVAGLIAAARGEGDRIAGVAPGARIYPVRMADSVDQTTTGALAAAIDDAADSGARVINMSLDIPHDYDAIHEAIRRAQQQDVLVVAAAGNLQGGEGQGGTGRPSYPAAYEGVLAVAAVDEAGEPASWSNFGPWVDLAAYGDKLTVIAPGGSGYRVESGTSFAAAQVAGAAALVRERFPGLSAQEVAERLTASASVVGGRRNDHTGAGIVDPFAALTHLPGTGGQAQDRAATGAGGRLAVQPLPAAEPPLGGRAARALGWSGGLLLAVVLGLLGAPAVRRAARRRWRAGPAPGEGAPPPAPPAPAALALAWLGGGPRQGGRDGPAPHPMHQRPTTTSGGATHGDHA
ncbi:type VII secretion-associated serine protease mycosin [Streptomyces hoynatensis]|uniref:Type VII secretion-associated serine protease mycosin n=1 Tax=Streptomyces hoynatensis TaxID=1141874 RepID=A0A3A9ZBF8_9ACTN|nr:type VII secretion-associated serine protease mycosin [Streptomyces hoynatensis]RKN45608.1 type VII secretion-associated serine protease mycosin [Streptomyces hoynatensis]